MFIFESQTQMSQQRCSYREINTAKTDKFKELLANMLSLQLSDIIVFSLMNIDGKQADVRFAVLDGSVYYRPEKLHAEMAAFKNEVCSLGLFCRLSIWVNDIDASYVSQTSHKPQWKNMQDLQIGIASLRTKKLSNNG